MGALRTKMIEEMKLRNFASRTQKSYLAVMVGLAKHYHQFPDQLTQEQIRTYLLHLQERGLSSSSQNVAISGLRFFYQQVLGWTQEQIFLPPRKRTWRLPEVLSPREVERLLAAAVKLRDRCLLMTAYSAGLRVSELVHLKLNDIHTERMNRPAIRHQRDARRGPWTGSVHRRDQHALRPPGAPASARRRGGRSDRAGS